VIFNLPGSAMSVNAFTTMTGLEEEEDDEDEDEVSSWRISYVTFFSRPDRPRR
jgi:hypothetical protein